MDPFQLIEEGKIKRFFRSRKKLTKANLISHITHRAAGKETLFVEDDDYLFMLSLMKELSNEYAVTIFAFCLMPNHVHLLLKPDHDNLSEFMRDMCGQYARRFNKRYERKGHLFGGPFRQSIVNDDSYLLAASLYIHLNPVNAGLVSDPGKYRYSSLMLYTRDEAPRSFVKPDLVLSVLSDKARERKMRYKELVERGKAVEAGNVLEDEHVIVRFMASLKDNFPFFTRKLRTTATNMPPEEGVTDFENLLSSRKPESKKARKYLVEQLLARGYTRTQIAEKLNISRKTVFNILTFRE
ncbi:MAG TPA: transposase [Syntrophorhabdaceae bacterium]|nr:transposase [Syntrophorhabdaceae bacterium]